MPLTGAAWWDAEIPDNPRARPWSAALDEVFAFAPADLPLPPPNPPAPPPPYKIDYVSDWNARLLSRTYEQFKGKAKLQAFATNVIAPQAQATEEATQQLVTMTMIANSIGAQLDVIGRIVGQPRAGVDDITYRLYLRARVLANKSSGTVSDLYAVFAALYSLTGTGNMLYVPGWPVGFGTPGQASFELRILVPITDLQAMVGVGFLSDSKDAGVRGILEWKEQTDALTFTFAVAAMLSVAAAINDRVLNVFDTSMLPATGSLTIDAGFGNAETIGYDVILSPTQVHTTANLAQNHLVGAICELVGDPGLGFGDFNNITVGGAFAGAAQA